MVQCIHKYITSAYKCLDVKTLDLKNAVMKDLQTRMSQNLKYTNATQSSDKCNAGGVSVFYFCGMSPSCSD